MKRIFICTIGIFAAILMTANADAATANFKLLQTAKPIKRAYFGVDASVLGIRTGMTMSQAEAIAKKNYPSDMQVSATPVSSYGSSSNLTTKPTFPFVIFSKSKGNMTDTLYLNFTTPATGSTLYYIKRTINFNDVGPNGPAQLFPPISAIKASLVKKYGPPSYLLGGTGAVEIAWVFNKKSRLNCKAKSCVGRIINGGGEGGGVIVQGLFTKNVYDSNLQKDCGTSAGSPAVFKIMAVISRSGRGKATAGAVSVLMWDAQTCVNDGEQVRKQFCEHGHCHI